MPDYGDLNILNEDYRSFKAQYMHIMQLGDFGLENDTYFVEGQTVLQRKFGSGEVLSMGVQELNSSNGIELETPLDYVFPVKSGNDEIVAYRVVHNDGTLSQEIPYQTAGIMINGILPLFDRTPDPNDQGYGRENKGDLFGTGTAAEGSNIGLYNAYTDELISGFDYEAVGVTEEGYVPVKEAGKWGLFNIETKTMVIPCILDVITSVYNGMVYVEIDGRKGVLNLAETLAAGVEINEETMAEVVVDETAEPME